MKSPAWSTASIAPILFEVLAACFPARSAAQGAGEYSLIGTITSADAEPVAGAEVTIRSRGDRELRQVQSDSLGHFAAAHLADIPSAVRVRAFGFIARTVQVPEPGESHRVSMAVTLERAAAQLSNMAVTAAAPDSDSKLADYRERKATNSFARFIDGDEILRRKPPFVSEMLRGIGGVSLIAEGRMGNVVQIRGCTPLVWVDGVRMPGAQLDEVAAPEDVAAIEIYNSFAGIPARYFDRAARCGTILVWLRS
jgi:hypothetical protein